MSNKKNLLVSMIIAGSTLFGCQNNVVEEVQQEEQTKEEVQQDEQQMTEEERQAHIDEIRKSINGEQEEMTTEEYFEQQREQERKEKSQEAIASAHNWREYNDIIIHGFPETEKQEEKPREKTYLETISEIRGEKIKRGLTYENFLLVGDVDFNSLYAVNQLFGEGELIGERGNIQQYRWTSGSGSNYKVVQIMFVDGMVESKSQSGLK